MYHLKTYLTEKMRPKNQANYKYYILLEKNEIKWFFYVEKKENFRSLFNILKKFCILSNFLMDYQIFDNLGHGHFAEVYFIINNFTKQKFAAKIFTKETEKFNKNSVIVLSFFFFIIIIFSVFNQERNRNHEINARKCLCVKTL